MHIGVPSSDQFNCRKLKIEQKFRFSTNIGAHKRYFLVLIFGETEKAARHTLSFSRKTQSSGKRWRRRRGGKKNNFAFEKIQWRVKWNRCKIEDKDKSSTTGHFTRTQNASTLRKARIHFVCFEHSLDVVTLLGCVRVFVCVFFFHFAASTTNRIENYLFLFFDFYFFAHRSHAFSHRRQISDHTLPLSAVRPTIEKRKNRWKKTNYSICFVVTRASHRRIER